MIPSFQYTVIGYPDGYVEYKLITSIEYWSERYQHKVYVPAGYISDGASGALDVPGSRSWWVHDRICDKPYWENGTRITAWQASRVLSDILFEEGKASKYLSRITSTVRGYYWFWATFLFGCKAAKTNGWW